MDSTLDNKAGEGRLASLDEQLSNLAREAGVSPSSPPTSMKVPRALLEAIPRLGDWRYPAAVGLVLLASVGGGAWWWSSAGTAVVPSSNPTPLTQVPPKDIAPTSVAPSPDLAQQLGPMARDLAALRQAVEKLQLRQDQLVRDNDGVAKQIAAGQAEIARNNNVIDEIKAVQSQMAQESKTVTERLNASQEQLARLIANASPPKVEAEAPEQTSEQPKVTPQEQPKIASDVPLPRPRRPTNVIQAHKPARPQANKPQPSAWPWSVR
ncbi:hypothetical protein [Bradyrhizobium sp. RD5-C2]|uniref:hypothetical protein n=1 Tax=Bradyrhizobium sp. RD5-C2 TaxID=244562 RepID=UPI001CC3B5E5|nr:hypothetical protein [Bradyrhizobium sp. RD5-C2]GIQ74106.1 hypothetical protein BraRD5C2_25440 [Bradyrhizobium sp. RD5-C2]